MEEGGEEREKKAGETRVPQLGKRMGGKEGGRKGGRSATKRKNRTAAGQDISHTFLSHPSFSPSLPPSPLPTGAPSASV